MRAVARAAGLGEDFSGHSGRIGKLSLTGLGRIPTGGCPGRIVTGCNPAYKSRFIVAQWMAWRDTEGG